MSISCLSSLKHPAQEATETEQKALPVISDFTPEHKTRGASSSGQWDSN